jgi:hypothetical protein
LGDIAAFLESIDEAVKRPGWGVRVASIVAWSFCGLFLFGA